MAPDDLGPAGAAPAAVAMFQGYNRVLARPLSTAVSGDTVPSGGRSESRCFVSLTSEELAQALHLETSLSAGLGPLSLFRGKSGLQESLHSTTHSVSVTVFARHISQVTSMTGARLREGIVAPASEAELDEFVEFYGDSFVSTLVQEGEYHGVYTFYSQTRQEQKDLVKGLAAAGIVNGISLGLDLQKLISHFLSTAQVNSSFRQLISGHLNPEYPEPENLIAFAADFGSLPLTDPTVIEMATSGYASVPGIGRAFQAVAANRDQFTGTPFQSGLITQFARINEIRNQLKWVEATYETYGGHDDERLIDGLTLTRKDSETIRTLVNAYDRKATTALSMPPLPSLELGTPHLRVVAGQEGPFGGGGGNPFAFMDLDTYLRNRTRITALKLNAGARVDQLEVTYAGDHGETVERHGGEGGSEGPAARLREGEAITEVAGRFGARIDQLTITTSGGQKVNGGGTGAPTSSASPRHRGRSSWASAAAADPASTTWSFTPLPSSRRRGKAWRSRRWPQLTPGRAARGSWFFYKGLIELAWQKETPRIGSNGERTDGERWKQLLLFARTGAGNTPRNRRCAGVSLRRGDVRRCIPGDLHQRHHARVA